MAKNKQKQVSTASYHSRGEIGVSEALMDKPAQWDEVAKANSAALAALQTIGPGSVHGFVRHSYNERGELVND